MMDERYKDVLLSDEPAPEALQELRAAMQDDADLAEAVQQWEAARAEVRTKLKACLPDRDLLVLYALDELELDECLSAAEQARLQEARAQIEQALDEHPGLRDVVRDIQSASEAFSAHWEAQRTPQDRAPTDGKRADRAPRPSPSQRVERGWTRRLVLATVLIVVAVGTLFLLPLDSGTALSTVEVISGEQRTIDFADGSSVRLVGPAEMAYQPASDDRSFNRQVTLDAGRGFFEVETASSPFTVETPTARTTVIGTKFGVTANANETEVVLASGAVTLESREQPGNAVTLAPGQASNVRRAAAPTPPSAVDVSEKLAWSGLFVFRDTPVRQIAERLSTQYGVPIEVHPELQADAVTGTFERSRSVEDILGVIASTLGAEVKRVEGTSIYRLAPASGR